ncbi:MAG: chloride channel protein [Thermoguttaceae bacterium]|nr:chloride channel protein [Thermoguttaceae bacterium]
MSSENKPMRFPEAGNSHGIQSLWGEYASKVSAALRRFLTLLFISVIFASFAGYAGALFRLSVVWANDFRHLHPGLLFLLPFGGWIIASLYKRYKTDTRNAFAVMTESVQTGKPISSAASPLIWVSTFISHLFGASAGCEGASLMIGGGIGSTAGRLFHLNNEDSELIVLCGMAAAFAPLLGTPIAAAVFVVELTRTFSRSRLLMATTSSLVAYAAVEPLGLHPIRFALTVSEYSLTLVVGVALIALVGLVCAEALRRGIDAVTVWRQKSERPIATIVFGAILIVAITFQLGTYDYNGLGVDVIARAFNGQADSTAFFWKLALTVIAMGVGFKGGQIVPAFFIGSTLGCTLAGVVGLDPAVGAAVGMIAVFSGVVRCPFAALVMSIEIFGVASLPIFILACGAEQLVIRNAEC